MYVQNMLLYFNDIDSYYQTTSRCVCPSTSYIIGCYICIYIHIYIYIYIYAYTIICDQICQKGSYTRTVSRHTFHRHLLAASMHQQHMCLLLLKVEQSAFTQAFFSSLSGIHECLGNL